MSEVGLVMVSLQDTIMRRMTVATNTDMFIVTLGTEDQLPTCFLFPSDAFWHKTETNLSITFSLLSHFNILVAKINQDCYFVWFYRAEVTRIDRKLVLTQCYLMFIEINRSLGLTVIIPDERKHRSRSQSWTGNTGVTLVYLSVTPDLAPLLSEDTGRCQPMRDQYCDHLTNRREVVLPLYYHEYYWKSDQL